MPGLVQLHKHHCREEETHLSATSKSLKMRPWISGGKLFQSFPAWMALDLVHIFPPECEALSLNYFSKPIFLPRRSELFTTG